MFLVMFQGLFSNQLGRIRYAGWEWAFMRAGFAVAVWFATWHTWRPWAIDLHDDYDVSRANGIPSLFDIAAIGQPGPTFVLGGLTILLLVLYAFGRWMLLTTGSLFAVHAVVGGIFSSPAGDHHATQVVGLVLLGQFAWFFWERVRPRTMAGNRLDRGGGAVFWSQQMICAAYLVSALSKWVNSGGGWIPGAKWVAQLPNIAVQFEKNRLQAYYDFLEMPASVTWNQKAIEALLAHPGILTVFLALGFYVELLAWVALFNRKTALITGTALMSLHLFVFLMMKLPFYYFEAVVFLFFVNLPYWIWKLAGGRAETTLTGPRSD